MTAPRPRGDGARPDVRFEPIARLPVDPATATVHEHGWQSWTPTSSYRLGESPHRPATARNRAIGYRSESPPGGAFQGEGLLAVRPSDGDAAHVFAARDAFDAVPSIRVELAGHEAIVSATGPIDHHVDDGAGGMDAALARWADRFAATMGRGPIRRAPTTWCSWYHYYTAVTDRDVAENLDAADALELPVEVVQIDDGYQAAIGDWLVPSERFASVPRLVETIRSRGRRAGIWVAPFLVGARSQVAAVHPEWLVPGASAGQNWDQELWVLDVTHPDAAAYLADVFATLSGWGVDFFKIDFLYAGALSGRRCLDISPVAAYRTGLELIRRSVGDAYVLGCGAPILPSVGLVDAMRVSPDTATRYEPPSGDLSQPSIRAAMVTGAARAFQHGRLWVNDPDCLVVRPEVERREEWATHVRRFGGLRASGDRLRALDGWGLERTRQLLAERPADVFVASS